VLEQLEQAKFDLVLSYTCLYKHRPGYDDRGPENMTDAQVRGLRDWVRNGGGLLAAHAATCIAESSPALGRLFGGVFVSHPVPFTFTVYPVSCEHPITSGIPSFEVHDEFYIQNYNPSVKIHMAAVYKEAIHPMVWSRSEGRGRVAHIAPGHFPAVWDTSAYQRLMLQAAGWLMKT
jgi:type 1 glutamine amidotransferase